MLVLTYLQVTTIVIFIVVFLTVVYAIPYRYYKLQIIMGYDGTLKRQLTLLKKIQDCCTLVRFDSKLKNLSSIDDIDRLAETATELNRELREKLIK